MQNEGGPAETQHAATTPIAEPFAWFRYCPEERTGSEDGTIVADEEIPDVCRITLEARCPPRQPRFSPKGTINNIACKIWK